MGALGLDSCVAIAFFTATDAHHDRAVAELSAADDRGEALLMAASAYSEIMVHAAGQERTDLIDRFVDRLRIEIVAVDRAIAARAALLRARHGSLRLPDALVLATAQARGARLLTFDGPLARLAGSSYD
ncbi:MAG TPA: PIN domain-containing protein [Solirubrobacterales bacterium]|nr:PIN domain-containing protein [Solirubrobacterales bacterium]